jgi:uncharacterized pyridoxamine 5'-phosphate oxidase family protein
MQEVLDFLKENRTVFIATSDQGRARVRPFGFMFEQDGSLWFCTSKKKEVYAQMQADPRVEFSCTSKDMVTLRVMGEAKFSDDMAVKERIFEISPLVKNIYGSADNPDFTVFSIDHGTAFMFDFSGNPPKSFTF